MLTNIPIEISDQNLSAIYLVINIKNPSSWIDVFQAIKLARQKLVN